MVREHILYERTHSKWEGRVRSDGRSLSQKVPTYVQLVTDRVAMSWTFFAIPGVSLQNESLGISNNLVWNIGNPIPHEIVRNSRIFILQKKSMATLSVTSCNGSMINNNELHNIMFFFYYM